MPDPYTLPDRTESDAKKFYEQHGYWPSNAPFVNPTCFNAAGMVRAMVANREVAEAKKRAEADAEEVKQNNLIQKILNAFKPSLIPFLKPKEQKTQKTKTFSFTAHYKQVLEQVMPLLIAAPDPQGNRWTKVTPYFSAADLLKVLRHVELFDSHDIDVSDSKQMDARGKSLKAAASKLGYQFLGGRVEGSDAEREAIRNHLVKILEQELAKPQNTKLVRRA